jgi:hypothetical protein
MSVGIINQRENDIHTMRRDTLVILGIRRDTILLLVSWLVLDALIHEKRAGPSRDGNESDLSRVEQLPARQ